MIRLHNCGSKLRPINVILASRSLEYVNISLNKSSYTGAYEALLIDQFYGAESIRNLGSNNSTGNRDFNGVFCRLMLRNVGEPNSICSEYQLYVQICMTSVEPLDYLTSSETDSTQLSVCSNFHSEFRTITLFRYLYKTNGRERHRTNLFSVKK